LLIKNNIDPINDIKKISIIPLSVIINKNSSEKYLTSSMWAILS
jgi:hypothetical protein